ncbi:hypothetical protein GGI25_005398 [Coemansia spiralis]|uniref:UBR-type domain-containing protein n=2 Tax=Coemansia TaxID=4863 RepID=A0A9W8KWH7_9FUNG|nr:hypothetical protein BX070DRAFT_229125 [Coemansia spiralis]KAJ1991218.1 hypothetical protein EDC05_003580 [Coemansia umbellata]KAJ2621188.1 hypothetical protein GGI26_004357 [Coemansia sp. RSA 1358]KAJ2671707.1 hypothetical protein GGI25_005398 [Coemansia spiralis]
MTAAETTKTSLSEKNNTAADKKENGEEIVTAAGYLQVQADLEREAAEVLPGKFDECTFDRGYIRQPLYACLTCTRPPAEYNSSLDNADDTAKHATQPAGMCYSCSIECHAGHEVVELFTKRNFRCDCGTKRLLPQTASGACCSLKKTRTALARLENSENKYNHNFWGYYCRCNTFYDPDSESREMILCFVCNDWYHDSCIGKFPEENKFEDYICRECVAVHPVLRYIDSKKMRYGLVSQGLVSDIASPSSMIPDTCDNTSSVANANSRKCPDSSEPAKKKARSSFCRLRNNTQAIDEKQPFDMFVVDGWKDDICTCIDCMRNIETSGLMFLIKEEEIVEPEVDETRGESLYESALKQLQSMDHSRAIDAAHAYRTLSSKLMEFLRPFAASGKVVTNQDIQTFFEEQKETK